MVGIELDNESEFSNLSEEKVLDVNEKSDSGMDDDSVKTDSPENVAMDSDSEDEIVVTKKQKRKVILEDSEEEEESKKEEDVQKPAEEKFIKNKSAEDVLDEVMNDDKNSDQESDNDKEGSKTEIEDTKKSQPPKPMFGDSDIFDAEESSDEEQSKKKKSSGNNSSNSDESDSNDEGGEEPGEDEGFDESSIDPKLLAKLKKFKGAGKTATRESKKRKAKDEALNIHSESQRLLRESDINLPYHQPTPKSLNDFLARANKKQEQYKCLRSVRDTKNAKVIEETLSEKKEKSLQKVTPSRDTKTTSTSETDDSKKDLNNESSKSYLFDTLCNLKHTEIESGDELPDIAPRDLNKDFSNSEKTDGETDTTTVENVGPKNSKDSQMDTISNLETGACPGGEQSAKVQNDEEYSSKCLNEDTENISEECSKTDKTEISDSEKLLYLKSAVTLDSTQTPKQKILSRLNLSIEEKPKLSGSPDDFISFDNEANTPHNPELNKFMDRFLKHSKKKTHKKSTDVDISIIQKESTGGEKEELKLNSFTYHIDDDDDTVTKTGEDIPGAKLLTLKEKLEAAMKVKREVSRQKREEMYNLENEEGFEEGADDLLDNEDELTDGSDTDIEDDDFDKQFGNEEYDDEEQEKVDNPFADEEAAEENEDGNEDADDDDDEGTMKLQMETSDEEDEEIKKPSKSQRVVISDDEESRDTVHNNSEKVGEDGAINDDDNANEDELSPLSKHLQSNTPKISRMGSLKLAIENTQDLYNDTQDGFNNNNYPVSDTQPSQSLNYLLEDSQSQMLDADGFLKVRSTQPTRRSLGLEEFPNQTQDNMEELLGLCSGRFVESSGLDKKKKLFNNDVSTQENDMDELVGLCSGVFATAKSQGRKRKLEDDEDEEDEESTNLLLSEDEATQKVEENESSSDDETPNIIIKAKKKKGFKTRDGKIRADFVDEEAELSGSEYESDENLDIEDEEDILMEEEGDKDNTVSETELRDQVGRAHLKQVIDEDHREIVRLKEMYLPDGDLHSDGAGRMRRFRWSSIDEGSQQDMFGNDSDGDEGADENEAAEELKWRMERHQREKFLEEQKENEEKEAQERDDSQILKFGKCFLQKKDPNKTTLHRSVSLPVTTNQTEGDSTFIKPSLKSSKRGSFLNRSKKDLAKIADRTKSKINPNQTTHSRNFVFQVISPDKNKTEPAVTVTKTTPSSKVKKPPNKKQKLDTKKNSKTKNSSLFKLLEN